MLNITILAVGKIKEAHLKTGIEKYIKYLRPYAKLDVVELKHEAFDERNAVKVKTIESDRIIKYLEKKNYFIIACDEKGREYNSENFSDYLIKIKKPICFVIGGSLGLDDNVKKKADSILALSRLTLPHELARLVLFEQVYRAATIINNKTYHY
jgi:23S rRNA (pseudouridine1915-N3)-methyltransferase